MSLYPHVLGDHVITSVDTATIASEYPRTVGRNAFRASHGSGGVQSVVVLETDRGARGWGLPLSGPVDPGRLLGRRVVELIDPELGVVEPAVLALDYPLHDLAATILDVPVYAMLGAAGSTPNDCYSGAVYFDDLDPATSPRGLAAIRDDLAADHDAGYRAFKLKVGRGYRWLPHAAGLQRDIEVTRLARELYPDAPIMVDANDGFSLQAVGEYLTAVADVGLFWIEEPFPERREDLLRLRERLADVGSSALVADGEYDPQPATVLDLAADGLLDVALMDVIGFGLTAWRRVMPELVARHTYASPHAWGVPLKTLYAAQLAAGLGNVITVEGVPGLTHGADTSGYLLQEGRLTVPETPGFGIPLTG